jgi:hypothetical protein
MIGYFDMEIPNKEPKKRKRHGCLSILAWVIGLVIVGFIAAIFIVEKKQENIVAERGKAETYSEVFNTNNLPDYTVSVADEEKFNKSIVTLLIKYRSGTFNYSTSGDVSLLRKLTTEESITSAQSAMTFLKNYYPEGYFLVVNQVNKTTEDQQIFPNFFLRASNEESTINFLVHELSHVGKISHPSCTGSGFAIEDKFIELKALDLPSGDELLQYISNPVTLESTYLQSNKMDLYTNLDEVISYTKSVRVARAFIRYQSGVIGESDPQALSRQLYYLSLHLKNLKEHHAASWTAVKKDKGLAYIISRVISMAKTELQAAKDEGVSGSTSTNFASSVDENLALVQANQALFDELYATAGFNNLDSLKNFTKQELSALGLDVKKF